MSNLNSGEDEFVRRFTAAQSDLRAYVVGLTPSRSDADDVLQEVNLALWHKRADYDPARDFLGWAFGFAMIEMRNHRSKSARSRLWFSDTVSSLIAESWSAEPSESDDRRDALLSCLQKLGNVERRYVAQFYGKQITVKELARVNGRPMSTIYKVLTRARDRLRSCVESSLAQTGHG